MRAAISPKTGAPGRKSHRITVDPGKTGSVFFLCGRPQPVTASCQGTSCTNLHTQQDDRLTEPRGYRTPRQVTPVSCAPPGPGHGPCPSQHSLQGEGPVQLGCRGGVGRVSLRHLCCMTRHLWRLNFWPVSSLGCRSTSSERPRLGRRAPAPVASGVSAIARCTEYGPARGTRLWWCNSTASRREDATSWRLCRSTRRW